MPRLRWHYLGAMAVAWALSGCREQKSGRQHAEQDASTGNDGAFHDGALRDGALHDAAVRDVGVPDGSGSPEASPIEPSYDGPLPDNVEPPRIPLPPHPAWQPPLVTLGTPGWQQSTVPFCSEDVGGLRPRVWATNGAVYVAVSSDCTPVLDAPSGVCNWNADRYGYTPLAVYKNDGSGWKRIYRHAAGGGGVMERMKDGRLVIPLSDCPEALVADDGTATCIWTGSATFSSQSASVSTSGILFVLGMDWSLSPSTFDLWRYDGVTWTKTKSWTDPSYLYAGRPPIEIVNGYLMVKDDAGVLWVGDPAQPDNLTSISKVPFGAGAPEWTYGTGDVLLSNSAGGLAHYDGAQWTLTEPVFGSLPAQSLATYLVDMWGAPDHTVFMRSDGDIAFGRWKPGAPFQILSTTLNISDFWGTSSTEVFLAVSDYAFGAYTCGGVFLLRYDGAVFHQF